MKDVTDITTKKKVIGGTGGTISKFSLKKKQELILSEESALAQVIELLEYYDINVDALPMVQGVNPLESTLTQLVTYIRQGRVEIMRDEKQVINVHLTLADGETVMVFTEMNAKHKLAMDRAMSKGGGNYERIYSLMASMAGLPADAISKLKARDIAVIEILGMVFLAA